MSDDLHQRGMKVRRKVLGDAHVDRAEQNKTAIDEDFQHYITQAAWGSVWTGEAIDLKTRSLLTIALLAGLGHHEELAMHIRATKNTGATVAEIREALMHVAVYAGVPAANAAFAILKKVAAENGL
ncbi:MAG TPA: 4-carboxymuconolactone decarboxylase [Alphaproteobacteria bacterium]|jgi:4-carboxymuconolactone decarboxylase